MTSLLLEKLTQAPRTSQLAAVARDAILAIRLHLTYRHSGVDSLGPLSRRLGGGEAALRHIHVAGAMASIWPERFTLSPPCCPCLSHDEALLGNLIEAVANDDRARFDAESRDFLHDEARAALWNMWEWAVRPG